jgi:hypothetical protein
VTGQICNHEVVSSIPTPGSHIMPGRSAMAFNVAE